MIFGLIGFPLEHSRSPEWFHAKFRETGRRHDEYRLFPLPSLTGFHDLLHEHPSLAGLNVTIPHKITILPQLDAVDETARAVGAVNTILIRRMGNIVHTTGYNTDAPAFLSSLEGLPVRGPALILGNGGASRAVAYALTLKQIPFHIVTRHAGAGISFATLTAKILREHPFIINTTPLGMHPGTAECPPLPYDGLTPGHLLYDLVYNPEQTLFMKQGHARGAATVNGMAMLHLQAELAYRLFTVEYF